MGSLRSSAQAHELPPHEIFDFAGTPGLGHLATESLAANRNQSSRPSRVQERLQYQGRRHLVREPAPAGTAGAAAEESPLGRYAREPLVNHRHVEAGGAAQLIGQAERSLGLR